MTTTGFLLEFSIEGFRGIARLVAEPGGRSLTLTGENGAGKSSATDAFFWGCGGKIDGAMKNGVDEMTVKLRVSDDGDELLIRRAQKRGKRDVFRIEEIERPGERRRGPLRDPKTIVERFRVAIGRNAFSLLSEPARVDLVRRLAPGLDVSDLVTRRAERYEERRRVGQQRDDLDAQARGIVVPEAPEVGEEQSITALLAERDAAAGALRVREEGERAIVQQRASLAALERRREALVAEVANLPARLVEAEAKVQRRAELQQSVSARTAASLAAAEEVERLERLLADAQVAFRAREADAIIARRELAALGPPPDLDAIARENAELAGDGVRTLALIRDQQREIETAQAAIDATPVPDLASYTVRLRGVEQHNDQVRERRARAAEAQAAATQRQRLRDATTRHAEGYAALTREIEAIDAEREVRIAGAACPVLGLALTPDGVTYPGANGPVPIGDLSTGEKIALDIEIAAAMKLRMIPVPAWGELDARHRERINRLATDRGIQLVRELTTLAGPLAVEIEDGGAVEAGE